MKSSAIAVALPFSCILGLLAPMTSTTMGKESLTLYTLTYIISLIDHCGHQCAVEKQYVWIYGTIQFGFIVCFSHIFFELVRVFISQEQNKTLLLFLSLKFLLVLFVQVHMQPVVSIVLATLVGFGLTMSGTTGLVEFLKWRRRQRTAEPPSSSQEDPPPVQTDQSISVS